MTNETLLDQTVSVTDFGWLVKLSPLGLIFVFVMVICYFCRRLKNIPTSWVWPITLVGVLFYLVIAPEDTKHGVYEHLVYNLMYGSVASIFGTFGAWALHDKAFAALVSKWPVFGFLVSDEINPNKPTPKP